MALYSPTFTSCPSVCLCVWEREREKDREREKKEKSWRQGEREEERKIWVEEKDMSGGERQREKEREKEKSQLTREPDSHWQSFSACPTQWNSRFCAWDPGSAHMFLPAPIHPAGSWRHGNVLSGSLTGGRGNSGWESGLISINIQHGPGPSALHHHLSKHCLPNVFRHCASRGGVLDKVL